MLSLCWEVRLSTYSQTNCLSFYLCCSGLLPDLCKSRLNIAYFGEGGTAEDLDEFENLELQHQVAAAETSISVSKDGLGANTNLCKLPWSLHCSLLHCILKLNVCQYLSTLN